MFNDKRLYVRGQRCFPLAISHICQLQFATYAFSQKVLQQAVKISLCQ